MSDEFDPRLAALNHAARIGDADARNLATAIACALIYVGDRLRALDHERPFHLSDYQEEPKR